MIEFEKRAMIEAEDKYTFRQSSQISGQTGLIGYLRADMDTDGNGFFSSWNDWRKDLKTDEFKAEFDEVINSLREEGDILHNRKALASYCYSTPQSKMQTEQDYYGVRVDTEKYAYLLRLNPNKGEYNLYCYCYVKDWLDGHMKEAERGMSGFFLLFLIHKLNLREDRHGFTAIVNAFKIVIIKTRIIREYSRKNTLD